MAHDLKSQVKYRQDLTFRFEYEQDLTFRVFLRTYEMVNDLAFQVLIFTTSWSDSYDSLQAEETFYDLFHSDSLAQWAQVN